MIYNPNQTKTEPKTKPIFKVIRGCSGSGGSRKSSVSLGGSSGGRNDKNFLSDIGNSCDKLNLLANKGDCAMPHDDVMATSVVHQHQSTFGVPGFGNNPFALQLGAKMYQSQSSPMNNI